MQRKLSIALFLFLLAGSLISISVHAEDSVTTKAPVIRPEINSLIQLLSDQKVLVPESENHPGLELSFPKMNPATQSPHIWVTLRESPSETQFIHLNKNTHIFIDQGVWRVVLLTVRKTPNRPFYIQRNFTLSGRLEDLCWSGNKKVAYSYIEHSIVDHGFLRADKATSAVATLFLSQEKAARFKELMMPDRLTVLARKAAAQLANQTTHPGAASVRSQLAGLIAERFMERFSSGEFLDLVHVRTFLKTILHEDAIREGVKVDQEIEGLFSTLRTLRNPRHWSWKDGSPLKVSLESFLKNVLKTSIKSVR